ncbi:hypothetical protein, partial [uncultured Gammaproteobacteria bacterium]
LLEDCLQINTREGYRHWGCSQYFCRTLQGGI